MPSLTPATADSRETPAMIDGRGIVRASPVRPENRTVGPAAEVAKGQCQGESSRQRSMALTSSCKGEGVRMVSRALAEVFG